ncbi:hypothetical protein RB195_016806 [Necator americanus]|uniref:Uncharacterized protein n=1 Tax=Necator americanus TaxID=51031 RepID=A0ABR1C3S7_NECAM
MDNCESGCDRSARLSVAVGIVQGSLLLPPISRVRHGPTSIPTAVFTAPLRAQPAMQLPVLHVVSTQLYLGRSGTWRPGSLKDIGEGFGQGDGTMATQHLG